LGGDNQVTVSNSWESEMAEVSVGLVKVEHFDKHYGSHVKQMQALVTAFQLELGNPTRWSKAQAEQLYALAACVAELSNAVQQLVHYNRQEHREKIRL
jgi:hypothetical protein